MSQISEMLKVPVPVFVTVRLCGELTVPAAWLPKTKALAERRIAGALAPPPETDTICGLLLALSLNVTAAVNTPLAFGTNWTLTVQLAPAAKLVPQLLLCLKRFGYAPVSQISDMLKVALPVFFTVRVWAGLVVLAGWLPKDRLVGEKLREGWAEAPANLEMQNTTNNVKSARRTCQPDRHAFRPLRRAYRKRSIQTGIILLRWSAKGD